LEHTIVALMQDRPGVLTRVVSLFRRRGFNITSLAVGHSETAGISRMTLVVDAPDVEQVVKQLYRLIEVIKVGDLTAEPTVERELALIKLHTPGPRRAEILALITAFAAEIADAGPNTLVVEVVGPPAKVESFITALRPFGIKEIMRTGRVAMLRGAATHQLPADFADPTPAPVAV
jgi:acetolactate synthase-1/3 small subunit